MICECGGLLIVIGIENYPEEISGEEKLSYNRVCDVQCSICEKIYYSKPFDEGTKLNIVKKTRKI
jgi:hypothetical protein